MPFRFKFWLPAGSVCFLLSSLEMEELRDDTFNNADIITLQKEWDEVSCPICLDHPHNAVLLFCSSHEKGCRSYICDTSYRHSNCLDQFKKSRVMQEDSSSPSNSPAQDSSAVELNPAESSDGIMTGSSRSIDRTLESNSLKCPLCRGTIKRCAIVTEAREYLNLKPRNCSRESCSFTGNYMDLRKHARRVHPSTRPLDIDPLRQRAWRRLETQREHGDILSAIRSAMPGAIVLGDYVIDNGDAFSRERDFGGSDGPLWSTLFLFHMISSSRFGSLDEARRSSRPWRTHRRSYEPRNMWGANLLGLRDDVVVDADEFNMDDDDNDVTIPRRRRRFTRARRNEDSHDE